VAGSARAWLERGLYAALRAVEGGAAVSRALHRQGDRVEIAGRTVPPAAGLVVLAIGKAAVPMADAACACLGERVRAGLIVTGDGPDVAPLGPLRLLRAGHPVPDARSARAGAALLETAAAVAPDDELLVLLSGGASALTSSPVPGLTPDHLAATTDTLLACGADIDETNCVRKHVSAVGGGALAAACPAARIHVLVVSDVVGDRLDVIGSGPCTGDPGTYGQALEIVERRGIRPRLPEAVLRHLEAGARGAVPETVKPGAATLDRVHATIVARNADARAAVVRAVAPGEVEAIDLGEILSGEARIAGRRLVVLARSLSRDTPRLLVAGGETVVTLRGHGRGGRSQELALAAAIELAEGGDASRIFVLAAGTDGRDGPTDVAGGFVDAGSFARARAAGLDPYRLLADNDAYRFLEASDGLVRTGPTGTNVMDLALVHVGPLPSAAHGG
jgi:hydroxypyruvate reductase